MERDAVRHAGTETASGMRAREDICACAKLMAACRHGIERRMLRMRAVCARAFHGYEQYVRCAST